MMSSPESNSLDVNTNHHSIHSLLCKKLLSFDRSFIIALGVGKSILVTKIAFIIFYSLMITQQIILCCLSINISHIHILLYFDSRLNAGNYIHQGWLQNYDLLRSWGNIHTIMLTLSRMEISRCGLVTLGGITDLCQHHFSQWLGA